METAATSFSLIELFTRADIVVKIVMVGLAFTSVWSWALTIEKWLQVRKLDAGARAVELALAEAKATENIEELSRQGDPSARIISIGLNEARAARRGGTLSEAGAAMAIERMQRSMEAQLSREMAKAERGLGVLATIGTSATFVGLFGTVWGIMNSFRA
ncbi:MAG: MotA/TolQ/ExbB proton channel family protein, partial [Pseudomonadota bacterium]